MLFHYRVRQIKHEWVNDVPSQGIYCILSDIKEARQFNVEELKKLSECMLDCSLIMKIKVTTNSDSNSDIIWMTELCFRLLI